MVGSVFFRGIIFGAALIAPFSLFGMDKNIVKREVELRPIGKPETVTKEMIVSNTKKFKFRVKVGDEVQFCQEVRPGTATPPLPCYFKTALFKNNKFVANDKDGQITFIMLESEEAQKAKLFKALQQPIPTAQRLHYKHTGTGCSECLVPTPSNFEKARTLWQSFSSVPTTTTTTSTPNIKTSVEIPRVEEVYSEESGDVATSGGSSDNSVGNKVVVGDKKEDIVPITEEEYDKKEENQEKAVQSNNKEQNNDKKPEIKANTSWLRFFTMRRMLMVGIGVTALVYLNWNYLKTLIKR